MPRDAKTRFSRRRVLAQLLTGAGAVLLTGCEAVREPIVVGCLTLIL